MGVVRWIHNNNKKKKKRVRFVCVQYCEWTTTTISLPFIQRERRCERTSLTTRFKYCQSVEFSNFTREEVKILHSVRALFRRLLFHCYYSKRFFFRSSISSIAMFNNLILSFIWKQFNRRNILFNTFLWYGRHFNIYKERKKEKKSSTAVLWFQWYFKWIFCENSGIDQFPKWIK